MRTWRHTWSHLLAAYQHIIAYRMYQGQSCQSNHHPVSNSFDFWGLCSDPKGWRRIRQPKQRIHQPTLRQPRFDNQGSTTKNGGFVNQGSSTKKLDSSTKRFVNQKKLDSSTKNGGFINQGSSTKVRQPKNTDSSTKDSSTKRLDSSTKNGGFINQGSSTKNTDSSTKDSSTKRLDSSKNGGFEGSGTFVACLEVEKLSLTCRCCVSCS